MASPNIQCAYRASPADLQDFKTAHLLGVCPRAQFSAMLLGSGASVFVSVAAYALYTSSAEVPGPEFPAPTAEIWLDMAELVRSLLQLRVAAAAAAIARLRCIWGICT